MYMAVFNPSLYRLSSFHLVLCRCFKAIILVGILPFKPNIHIQILQTDPHTFPQRIS